MFTDAEVKNPAEAVVNDEVDNPVVDLPSGEKPKPSTEPEMLTKEQAEKLANERHSKLDKRISELEKITQRADARAKAAEDRLAKAARQAEDAERDSIKDSPDALSLFEQRVKLRQDREAFEAERVAHAEDIAEAKQYKITRVADEIASEYEVDSSLLVQLTDGSREKMEKLAKSLPKKEAGDNKPNLQKPPKPDSGKTSGRFGKPTLDQLEHMSMDEYAEYVKDRDKHK